MSRGGDACFPCYALASTLLDLRLSVRNSPDPLLVACAAKASMVELPERGGEGGENDHGRLQPSGKTHGRRSLPSRTEFYLVLERWSSGPVVQWSSQGVEGSPGQTRSTSHG